MMEFNFCGAALTALPSGGLWWAHARILCVSDLHLGKSRRMARRAGALLPPYEVAETLYKLESDIARLNPANVICLGDSFDDLAASGEIDDAARLRLTVAQAGRMWVWIEGNHDAGPLNLGGQHLAEMAHDGLVFRHIAAANPPKVGGEVSGHYHPKARLAGQSLPAFLCSADRLILPAYGVYTGGMMADRAPLMDIIGDDSHAFLCRAGRVLQIPLRRDTAQSR